MRTAFAVSSSGLQVILPGICRQRLALVLTGILALTLCSCGDLPFAKKPPPPTTEAAFELPPATPPPPPVTAPAAPSASASGSSTMDSRLADLANQVEAMRVRLQAAEGKLAEQDHQLQQFSQTGGPQQSQTRNRLLSLERDLAAVQERLARLEGQRPAAARVPESSPAAPAIREVAPPPAAPKSSTDPFVEGMTQYKKKSYAAARQQLEIFLKEHPKGDKATEARYYLADSLLQEKKYDEAIVEFNKIIEGNPKSNLAPAALFKQSQAFKAQGKTKVANLVLEKLVADYPKSAEAAQARKLLGTRP